MKNENSWWNKESGSHKIWIKVAFIQRDNKAKILLNWKRITKTHVGLQHKIWWLNQNQCGNTQLILIAFYVGLKLVM